MRWRRDVFRSSPFPTPIRRSLYVKSAVGLAGLGGRTITGFAPTLLGDGANVLRPARAPVQGGGASQHNVSAMRMDFGDGYHQDVQFGPIDDRLDRQMRWEKLTRADALEMEQFFRDNAGLAFAYTLPRENAPRYWVCTQWTRDETAPDHADIRATFQERHPSRYIE